MRWNRWIYSNWRLQHPSIRNGRSSRQTIRKDMVEPNSTINRLDMIDSHGPPHPAALGGTLPSSSRVTCTEVGHIPRYKTWPSKFIWLKSDQNEMKLEIDNREIAGKFQNIFWTLNSILLNKTWVKGEISKEISEYFELNEN